MEKLLSIIEAQRELLNFIGYDIDIKKGEIPLFESIDIKKGNTKVGTFDIKKSNLYYLDKDGYLISILCSFAISLIFSLSAELAATPPDNAIVL